MVKSHETTHSLGEQHGGRRRQESDKSFDIRNNIQT